MTIAESFRRFRKEFNLSQKQVADTLGIKQPSYHVYEAGTIPSATVVLKLANAYKVSTDYLLGQSDSPRPTNFDEREVKAAFAFRDAWLEAMKKLPTAPMTGQVPAQ